VAVAARRRRTGRYPRAGAPGRGRSAVDAAHWRRRLGDRMRGGEGVTPHPPPSPVHPSQRVASTSCVSAPSPLRPCVSDPATGRTLPQRGGRVHVRTASASASRRRRARAPRTRAKTPDGGGSNCYDPPSSYHTVFDCRGPRFASEAADVPRAVVVRLRFVDRLGRGVGVGRAAWACGPRCRCVAFAGFVPNPPCPPSPEGVLACACRARRCLSGVGGCAPAGISRGWGLRSCSGPSCGIFRDGGTCRSVPAGAMLPRPLGSPSSDRRRGCLDAGRQEGATTPVRMGRGRLSFRARRIGRGGRPA